MSTFTPGISGQLLTAEQYFALPDVGPSELVRGEIVMMTPPGARHGWLCAEIARLLSNFVSEHDLGYVLTNDSGVVTTRRPDSVRGADVSYYSYSRLPKGELPRGYPEQSPELVFEVLSPTNVWKEMLEKVSEYLNADVLRVCVLDPDSKTLVVYYPDRPEISLSGEEELTLPEILPGFVLPLTTLFP